MDLWSEHGLLTARQARASGLSSDRVRRAVLRGDLLDLHRGVVVDRQAWEEADLRGQHLLRVRAAQAALGSRWVAARRSAAVVWDLPLLGDPPAVPPLVAARRSLSDRASDRHRRLAALPESDREERDGIGTTVLARTAVDLAREESYRGGVVVMDAALRRGLTHESVHAQLGAATRRKGVDQARRVAAFGDGRAENPLESISRVLVVELGHPVPDLQVELWLHGRLLGRVDMLWEELRLVAEPDGALKYQLPEDLVADKRRQEGIEDAGAEVVRWGWPEAWRDHAIVEARMQRGLLRAQRTVLHPDLVLRRSELPRTA